MEKKKAKLSLEKRHNLTGWAFLLPASILIFVFCFYPMSQAILLSFRKTGGVFNGVANYARIFKDKTFQQYLLLFCDSGTDHACARTDAGTAAE